MANKLVNIGVIAGSLLLPIGNGATAETLVPLEFVQEKVQIHNPELADGVLRGTLVNNSGRPVSDVQVSISYSWQWRNEFEPGTGDPGWAELHVLPDRLAPNEATEFSFALERPMPSRDDGKLVPAVVVTGYTQFD